MHVDTMLRRLSWQAGQDWIDNRASEQCRLDKDNNIDGGKETRVRETLVSLKASCIARMHRSTGTAPIQLGMGLGERSTCYMEMCLPGAGGKRTNQGPAKPCKAAARTEPPNAGETLETSSYWLGAFDKSRRQCRAILSFGITEGFMVWSAVEFRVSVSFWASNSLPRQVSTWS